jgi:putative transposase
MLISRRRLPHWVPDGKIVFVTWRLAGSPPPPVPEILTAENTGRVPGPPKRLSGPVWLQDGRVAKLVAEAVVYGSEEKGFYDLYAWVIMSNHVHMIIEPRAPMPAIMRWLKGRTAVRVNRILGRTGEAFWRDESYDHWVRSPRELLELVGYVEGNPVKAGLVETEEDWPWSSARKRADDASRSSAPRFG